MNFSEEFISWVKLLYTNISSNCKINGSISIIFLLERGVRQGCPLAPLLYVIIAQVLTTLVNDNPLIKGIEVNGMETKLSQYADDTNALLTGDNSIFELFETLKSFEHVSGALVNPTKTKALWLGSNVGRTDEPLGLAWTDKDIEVLGLPIGNSIDQNQLVWDAKVASIRQNLNPWRLSDLSLKGKIIVLKQLILPKVSYRAVIYPPSSRILATLTKVFEDFLWNGKRPKIPTRILQLPVQQGGLGLIHFLISLTLIGMSEH